MSSLESRSGVKANADQNKHYVRIWETVNLIPCGKVASYGQVADLAGLPGRARLVGKSLGHVPSATSVNWHRVLRASGQIAFPKGSQQALLQIGLLQQEGVAVFNNRVKLKTFQWHPDMGELMFLMKY